MKIIAYSKIPATTPFVHLGYLSASTVSSKPIQGLLFSGVILLVAGVSIISRGLWRRRKSPEAAKVAGMPTPRHVVVGYALLLFAVLVVSSAYVFGEKEKAFVYPQKVTSFHMHVVKRYIAKLSEPGNDANQITVLPTQEGEYDLPSLLSARGKEQYKDGWNTSLKLRAIRRDGHLTYVLVSAGPDRVMGTPDDITSPIEQHE
jgi:hypothetical protein